MTPEWRCRTVACGYEWDTTTPHPTEEIIERLRREVDSQQRQLNISWEKESELATLLRLEKEGRRNDQTELEPLRLKAERLDRQLLLEEEKAEKRDKLQGWGFWFGLVGFTIGGTIAGLLSWSIPGTVLACILTAFAAVLLANLLIDNDVLG